MMTFNSPRNFKQGRLIANRFRWIDLIIAGIGIAASVIMIMIYITTLHGANDYIICALLAPGVICFVLVCPAGIYHNVLEFIIVMINYTRSIRLFVWGGVYKNDSEEELSTDVED